MIPSRIESGIEKQGHFFESHLNVFPGGFPVGHSSEYPGLYFKDQDPFIPQVLYEIARLFPLIGKFLVSESILMSHYPIYSLISLDKCQMD